MSTRRDFLAFTAGAVAARTVLPIGARAETPTPGSHPDADLIRICAEHAVNLETYNRDGGEGGIENPDPLWDAYAATRDAITAAQPQTLDGMLAKARAAKAEAGAARSDGTEDPEGGPAAQWAWNLVNDLLAGRAGA